MKMKREKQRKSKIFRNHNQFLAKSFSIGDHPGVSNNIKTSDYTESHRKNTDIKTDNSVENLWQLLNVHGSY